MVFTPFPVTTSLESNQPISTHGTVERANQLSLRCALRPISGQNAVPVSRAADEGLFGFKESPSDR